jgi:hypothetical protein
MSAILTSSYIRQIISYLDKYYFQSLAFDWNCLFMSWFCKMVHKDHTYRTILERVLVYQKDFAQENAFEVGIKRNGNSVK